MEADYEEIMTDRSGFAIAGEATKNANRARAQQAGKEITNSTNVMTRNLKQNPLTSDNLLKIQEDR